jgi:hypothetical protein
MLKLSSSTFIFLLWKIGGHYTSWRTLFGGPLIFMESSRLPTRLSQSFFSIFLSQFPLVTRRQKCSLWKLTPQCFVASSSFLKKQKKRMKLAKGHLVRSPLFKYKNVEYSSRFIFSSQPCSSWLTWWIKKKWRCVGVGAQDYLAVYEKDRVQASLVELICSCAAAPLVELNRGLQKKHLETQLYPSRT